MHNYLCDGYNVILLRLTHRGQITISIDICYKLLHQLLCSSIVIPFAQNPQDLKKEKTKKNSKISAQNLPALAVTLTSCLSGISWSCKLFTW